MKRFTYLVPVIVLLMFVACAAAKPKPTLEKTRVEEEEILYREWYNAYLSAYSLGAEADYSEVCDALQYSIQAALVNHPDEQYRALASFMGAFCKVSCLAGFGRQPLLDYPVFRQQVQLLLRHNE